MFTVPLQLDVPLAVRYIRRNGAKTVAVLGGNFGGTQQRTCCPKRAFRPHSESRQDYRPPTERVQFLRVTVRDSLQRRILRTSLFLKCAHTNGSENGFGASAQIVPSRLVHPSERGDERSFHRRVG